MRKKLVYIILTEVTSAIFYFFWAAPALTAKHMDIETLIPVLIVSLSSLALLLIILLSRMQRKSYPFETTVLITMVI